MLSPIGCFPRIPHTKLLLNIPKRSNDWREGQFMANGDNEEPIEFEDESDFEVDIRPDTAALRMFRNLTFKPWYALGEFVDNSISSGIKNFEKLKALNGKNYAVRISINFDEDRNVLVIEDNAAGISREELKVALKTGALPTDTSIGLNRHGVGMKAAAFWWGATLNIKSYPIGQDHGWESTMDISNDEVIQSKAQAKAIKHRGYSGTRIEISNLWQKIPQTSSQKTIKAYLPSIYRIFLDPKSEHYEIPCEIYYGDELLSFELPELLIAPFWKSKAIKPVSGEPDIHWREDITITMDSGKEIRGWIGILKTMSRDLSGFFLHYRGKGIAGVVPQMNSAEDKSTAKTLTISNDRKPKEIFGQVGSHTDSSFIGEFDISVFGKTITTDSPLWTDEERDEFFSKLQKKMLDPDKNFIAMATNYRRREASKEDVKDLIASSRKETQLISESIENKIDHEEPDVEESVGIANAEESIESNIFRYEFNDHENHHHIFQMEFIYDRSGDFLMIRENDEQYSHSVRINLGHPISDDLVITNDTKFLLLRILFGLSAAEVMLSNFDKNKIRKKMNEILSYVKENE
jgi:hypothetical protein